MINFQDLIHKVYFINIIEILVIFMMAFVFYKKYIKNSSSEKIVRGAFVLIIFWIIGKILIMINLRILGIFITYFSTLIFFSLIVVFQPELRKFLALLGQVKFFQKLILKESVQNKNNLVVDEIAKSLEYMSKNKTGALIVFHKDLVNVIPNMGTYLNADISSELLLTIFFPNTPLHDGAVIISDGKIVSAGAILPLTEKKGLGWRYGTRHRAAIGMSEHSETDTVLVVSEETGDISVVKQGQLKKYKNIDLLKIELLNILK